MIFKCKHQAAYLAVKELPVTEWVDADFSKVKIELLCVKCGETITKKVRKFNGGVKGFLGRKPVNT